MSANAKALIVVNGGVVQEVYCNYADVEIEVIDLDDLNDTPNPEKAARLDYARNQLDKVY